MISFELYPHPAGENNHIRHVYLIFIYHIYIWHLYFTFISDTHIRHFFDIYIWHSCLTFVFDVYVWHSYLTFIFDICIWHQNYIWHLYLTLMGKSMRFPYVNSKVYWFTHGSPNPLFHRCNFVLPYFHD